MAQALVRFLAAQYVERDGVEHRFFEGCFGIFGHGNLTGVGQALAQDPDLLTYYQARNEQAMVHAATGFAKPTAGSYRLPTKKPIAGLAEGIMRLYGRLPEG